MWVFKVIIFSAVFDFSGQTCPTQDDIFNFFADWPQTIDAAGLVAAINQQPECPSLPELVQPEPGTVLPDSDINFQWSGNGAQVTDWAIDVGSAAGLADYYASGQLGAVSMHLVTGLPEDCSDVHVRLHYQVESNWYFKDYLYMALCDVDADGDGLLDAVETNTGVFVGPSDTGTDPDDSDTDDDGLGDGDEVLGTPDGLDLPGMGCNPLKKNILLEYDWFDDNNDSGTCGPHSHRPTAAALQELADVFAASPLPNPDGTTGIVLIQDRGQGGVFTGGNFIDDPDGVLDGGVGGAEFHTYKDANFAANRDGYFHYVLLPHRYNTDSGSSGQAEINGDDLIVSLYCFGSDHNVAHTIMHELGHNLGLLHGGFQNCNYKPNYNSVMNYRYQFPGVDSDCTPPGNGVLDYSHGFHIDLDENDLDENDGICGDTAWDWDGDSVIEESVVFDINSSGNSGCGGTLTVLQDHDDWGDIFFLGILDGDRFLELIDCDNPPPEAGLR